jgi:hypothetical protein
LPDKRTLPPSTNQRLGVCPPIQLRQIIDGKGLQASDSEIQCYAPASTFA